MLHLVFNFMCILVAGVFMEGWGRKIPFPSCDVSCLLLWISYFRCVDPVIHQTSPSVLVLTLCSAYVLLPFTNVDSHTSYKGIVASLPFSWKHSCFDMPWSLLKLGLQWTSVHELNACHDSGCKSNWMRTKSDFLVRPTLTLITEFDLVLIQFGNATRSVERIKFVNRGVTVFFQCYWMGLIVAFLGAVELVKAWTFCSLTY